MDFILGCFQLTCWMMNFHHFGCCNNMSICSVGWGNKCGGVERQGAFIRRHKNVYFTNKNNWILPRNNSVRKIYGGLRPQGLQHAKFLCPPLWNLLKFMSTELVMLSNHLILCCPLLLLSSIFPSIGVFSNESTLCITYQRYLHS